MLIFSLTCLYFVTLTVMAKTRRLVFTSFTPVYHCKPRKTQRCLCMKSGVRSQWGRNGSLVNDAGSNLLLSIYLCDACSSLLTSEHPALRVYKIFRQEALAKGGKPGGREAPRRHFSRPADFGVMLRSSGLSLTNVV